MKLCILPLLLIFTILYASAAPREIIGPPGSGSFGSTVTVLPNGNVVITDPGFDQMSPAVADVGAAYLYSPEGGLISSLRGSTANDFVGWRVTVLANGNFVVISASWDNGAATGAGAVTWGNADTGFIGGPDAVVSSANSLVGSSASDRVGDFWITALKNGHYVVASPYWDNSDLAAADAGAVTWGDGFKGITGVVSSANSLVGTSMNDGVGGGGGSGIVQLRNGHYVVLSNSWTNGAVARAGAVTWCNSNGSTVGPVSAANSLVGTSLNDEVGNSQVLALNNGNYVVASPSWDDPLSGNPDAGAATWCNGSIGTSGPISTVNSLIGSSVDDRVGNFLVALTNGNYVVCSTGWNSLSSAVSDVGAATWGNGRTGIRGLVSAANSLVGTTLGDRVGYPCTALTNGNYVVSSYDWDNLSPPAIDAGAATWGNGVTGIKGPVTMANSLVGSSPDDRVGSVTALTNGNYVVSCVLWDNNAAGLTNVGAATWGDGRKGIKGTISAANSLIGSTNGDIIGGVLALTNGNYVVISPYWDSITPAAVDAGAATWGNGSTGIKGVVSAGNSLVGTTERDYLGGSVVYRATPLALKNGNYVLVSPHWDNAMLGATEAGALTWGNGSTGTAGTVSAANSLVGSQDSDLLGLYGFSGEYSTALEDGNYLIPSTNWGANPALTIGDGATGNSGYLNANNGVFGTSSLTSRSYDLVRQRYYARIPADNKIAIFSKEIRSLAKTNDAAPGSPDIAFSTAGSAAINEEGGVLTDYTLTGTGSKGKNRAVFSSLNDTDTLDLGLGVSDSLSELTSALPINAKATAFQGQLSQQAHRGLFEAIFSGTGITPANNRLLLLDNGFNLQLLQRVGQPISGLANATSAKFVEVLQSHTEDHIVLSYQLKTGIAPVVTVNNDTGVAVLDHSGNFYDNYVAREGESASSFGASGSFGQFTGRAASSTSNLIFFSAFLKPALGAAVPAVFQMKNAGFARQVIATAGMPAGATGQNYASLPALSEVNGLALYKALLTGPAAQNESLWRGTTLELREGDLIDAVNLPGVKLGRITRFWPAGTQIMVDATLTGTGVTKANSQALILRQSDNTNLILMRTGTVAPGCGPAKVATLSAVEVHPLTGRYAILGTLSGGLATNNQALWTGDTTLGDPTTQSILRTPSLRLRKGQVYSTLKTSQSLVRSIAMKPASDSSGAGARGLAQCLSKNGELAVYIVGDRTLTELVVLPP